MVTGYSTTAASILQVSTLRVATQESLTAEEYRVVRRRKGAPVEFLDMVELMAKIIERSFLGVDKSRASVVEEQL
jgi:hypothetical protein